MKKYIYKLIYHDRFNSEGTTRLLRDEYYKSKQPPFISQAYVECSLFSKIS